MCVYIGCAKEAELGNKICMDGSGKNLMCMDSSISIYCMLLIIVM